MQTYNSGFKEEFIHTLRLLHILGKMTSFLVVPHHRPHYTPSKNIDLQAESITAYTINESDIAFASIQNEHTHTHTHNTHAHNTYTHNTHTHNTHTHAAYRPILHTLHTLCPSSER